MVELVIENLSSFLVLSILTEALVEMFKKGFPKFIKDEVAFSLSLVLGVALCLSFQVNIFGLTPEQGFNYFFACFFTGLLISRGSNFLHDLFNRIKEVKQDNKENESN